MLLHVLKSLSLLFVFGGVIPYGLSVLFMQMCNNKVLDFEHCGDMRAFVYSINIMKVGVTFGLIISLVYFFSQIKTKD